ncbi:MAG TPA: hypothetical protein VJZ71_13775 [Phycisphaerae bacterium]|nr:hypothetical protein [Phycisphaerae bacterium]
MILKNLPPHLKKIFFSFVAMMVTLAVVWAVVRGLNRKEAGPDARPKELETATTSPA